MYLAIVCANKPDVPGNLYRFEYEVGEKAQFRTQGPIRTTNFFVCMH